MSNFRIEIQITSLAIIIGVVVMTIGYFSYQSLLKIVNYIQQVTYPDNKIFIIKEIDADLNALENTVRLYALTKNYDVLDVYYTHEDNISKNLKVLGKVKEENKYDVILIDSISNLSREKLELWNDILKIHLSKKGVFPAFSRLYSNLDEQKNDTISVDNQNVGVLENIQDSLTITPSTSIERKTIKKRIQKLEWEIYLNSKNKNVLESQLIEKNVVISQKINQLISKAETRAENALLQKTVEADMLAHTTFKRLKAFTISAVLLLFVALLTLFNYLRKARAAQRALTDATEKAETLARAKEQFVANVSHELRTPVNAIYGLTEQVLQKELDSSTSEMVSIIFKSAGHLKNIVNETLDFSKIHSTKIVLESVHFSPVEVINEVFTLVKYEATAKGVKLKLIWLGELPGILIGDPLRLKQIVINLVGNAIKFTEKGEIVIRINVLKNTDENVELEIQVTDTGIGIDKNKLDTVFEEYVQIEDRIGKKYSGTGLGLSIAKKLVEMQGGKISLESEQGVGTEVTFHILYPKGDPTKIEHIVKEIPKIPDSFGKLSILIADDEEYNRFLLKNILQKWGIHYMEAINGNEVTDAACNYQFDIVLMDINMPEMNGIEAAKAIIKCKPDIKIVAVTAVTEKLDQQECSKAGMKDFLYKPFTEKELFETIKSLTQEELIEKQPGKPAHPIDISELRRLAGNDEKFLSEMILLFIKSTQAGIKGIENAIKSENWIEVFENAHKMAAPVKHIGARHLYENIKLLEKTSKQSTAASSISPLFQEIKKEIEELNATLIAYLDKPKT